MARQREDGKWESIIDPGLGPSKVQKFVADTPEELFAKIETAQLNASQRIHTLSEYVNPDTAITVPEFKPRDLGPDELTQTVMELQNPTTAIQAIDRLITARVGASPEQIRDGLKSAKTIRLIEHYRLETQQFLDATPEYKKTPKNWEAMMTWLDAKEAPPSKKNLTLAFNALRETEGGLPDGINEEQPAEIPATEEGEERIAPNGSERIAPADQPRTRPRGTQSSGLRNGVPSNPAPPPKRAKWTRQQVLAMDSKEYERLLRTDPDFQKFVDSM